MDCGQLLSKSDPSFSIKVSFTLTSQIFFCWVSSISKVSRLYFSKSRVQSVKYFELWGFKKRSVHFPFPPKFIRAHSPQGQLSESTLPLSHQGRWRAMGGVVRTPHSWAGVIILYFCVWLHSFINSTIIYSEPTVPDADVIYGWRELTKPQWVFSLFLM